MAADDHEPIPEGEDDAAAARRRLAHVLAELVERVDEKEGYAHRHARRVAALAVGVAERLGLDHEALVSVHLGSLLHDVGKLCVPDELLRKPGPLTSDEWGVIRRHSEAGERVLVPFIRLSRVLSERLADDVLAVVRSHHERWDGAGYPDGIAGDLIPLGARIVGVCDAFEAMTETRTYRAALARPDALEELLRHSGSQFDPVCVDALIEAVAFGVESAHPEPATAGNTQRAA